MKFDLRQPCGQCPFRSDIAPYLTRGRVRELQRDLVDHQKSFTCHKTIDYDAMPEDEEGEVQADARPLDPNEQHCAGAAILLEKMGKPNQMMRWMERLRDANGEPYYDRRKLKMDAPVYPTFTAMRKAQPS